MDVADLVALHRVDPALLDRAPAVQWRPDERARLSAWPPLPCSICGDDTRTTRVIAPAGYGPRWLDLCRDHSLAVIPKLPAPLSKILADLRETAGELPVSAWTDETGWQHGD
ncbi:MULTISPECIES: hypothetical protein [unclassified Streptomyces]|uniref:hypothetical protein n=1 Tax=unclassified Streptomyces TaxID=2593676 RepID=UPI00148900AC|nr:MULTISPECIES: hypothetical protein [unclassified Streptomyces]